MEFTTLGFSLTDQCNVSCKMCCLGCSPQNTMVLDRELMKDYINQIKAIGTFDTIAFTGGEAIVQYELLKEIIRYATENGFRTTLVSNGYFAKNYNTGYNKMKSLREAGLKDVSISLDIWHQEYVPVEIAKNALRICSDLGVLSAVTLMDTKDAGSVIITLETFQKELYGIPFRVYPLFPIGSAEKNIPDEQIIRLCNPRDMICPFEKSIVVHYDGTIMMCCSQFSSKVPIAHLGQFGETSIEEAIKHFNENNFLYLLLTQGFRWYVDLAEQFGIHLQERYAVVCEVCYELFNNKDFMEKATPIVKEKADSLRLNKILGL